MKRPRPPADPDSPKAAYFRALRWLTGRELSEAQVRERLEDRGYTRAAASHAIQRLKDERAIDDRRAATAVARTEAKIRRRGPRRVLSKLMAMRIDRELAQEVVRELFGEADEEELLRVALERRLRGRPERLEDPAERRKILAHLVRQGFSSSAAVSAVRRRSRQDSQ
ncbi:MAG: RecX family transcriptional regulator [Vicinamibacterales bacterium]|nr:RecX family transcriptional regulator [Vicinamibacterales bacterium]